MFIGNRDGIYSVQKVEQLELQYSMKCKPCVTSLKLVCCSLVREGGNTPYDCPYGEAPPKSDTFSRLQADKNAGIS